MGRKSFKGRFLTFMTAAAVLMCTTDTAAETLQDIRNEKQAAESKKQEAESSLRNINKDIESISEEQEQVMAELEELDAELVDLLLSVDILESDIAVKEQEIAETKGELEKAKKQVSAQESAMARRIKFMYERGNTTYLELFVESKSMAEAVNKSDYSEKLYKYDRLMLERYRMARQDVENKEKQLEDELSELEEIKEDLNEQKEELDAMIAEKQETVEDFSERLAKAKSKAGQYKAQISQQTDNLKKLNQAEAEKIAEEARKKAEEEARKKAEEAAKKKAEEEARKKEAAERESDDIRLNEGGRSDIEVSKPEKRNESSEDSDGSDNDSSEEEEKPRGTSITASGSGIGADIANYGLSFVGCPYVAGGTSLTNGCDCSGFTQGVYSNFGISIPRSSYAQSAGGEEVSFDEAQAGDIVYYGGHVGIYIGNNQIVHASTPATGIKVSSVFYRSIITIRRYY